MFLKKKYAHKLFQTSSNLHAFAQKQNYPKSKSLKQLVSKFLKKKSIKNRIALSIFNVVIVKQSRSLLHCTIASEDFCPSE